MKPARFAYQAPTTVEEAIALLTTEPDPKILAGGQSLVPAMNFRLARPATLIDINHVAGLEHLEVRGDEVRIGALTRHRRLETDVVDGPLGVLLMDMARNVGHLPIRVRGTFGGSLAHADPAAEWCLLLAALSGSVIAFGPGGERQIDAAAFFHSVFTTDLAADEILTEARLPLLGPDHFVGFSSVSRRAGDFALVMAVVALRVVDEVVLEANIGVGGAGERPERLSGAEGELVGGRLSAAAIERASSAAAASIETLGDIHASADYRRDLIGVMTSRALTQAAQRAGSLTTSGS